jgi:hypothetical protein
VSRAETRVVPPAPRLAGCIRAAATDLYYNSVRLVSANALWGFSLLGAAFLFVTGSLAFAIVLIALVPLTAGLMGMATTLVRRRRLFWSDFAEAIRFRFMPHLGLGVAELFVVTVAVVDVGIGMRSPGLLGPMLVVGGLYTILAVWILSVTTWPLLLDPERAADGIRRTVRLGVLVAIAHPVRMGGLALTLAILLGASLVAAAAIVTVSGALALLIAAHYVLPAAARLEGRATREVDD